MSLGRKVGLGPGDIVLDGELPSPKGAQPRIFGSCLLWPNGRPSQLLLSTCLLWDLVRITTYQLNFLFIHVGLQLVL